MSQQQKAKNEELFMFRIESMCHNRDDRQEFV